MLSRLSNSKSPRLLLAGLRLLVGSLAFALGVAEPGAARADVMDGFIDPSDGQFDVGDFLLNKRGILLNPIIITEPAVGFGGGATAMYFHKSEEGKEKAKSGEVLGLPPSISFAMGLGTENGTWMAGGGHFGSWKKDTIRYVGGVGYSSLNLDFFVADQPLAYNLKGVFLVQELDFRILQTPVFLGARYVFARFESKFDLPPLVPPSADKTKKRGIRDYARYRELLLGSVSPFRFRFGEASSLVQRPISRDRAPLGLGFPSKRSSCTAG